jgi:hypothetical protein
MISKIVLEKNIFQIFSRCKSFRSADPSRRIRAESTDPAWNPGAGANLIKP